MNKFIKSLYLSIIISGVVYLLLYYFSLVFINPAILVLGLVIVFYGLLVIYFKYTNIRYTSKEIASKYNISAEENVVPTTIQDQSLLKPVNDKPAVPFPKELIQTHNSIVLEEIHTPVKVTPVVKKPKVIPKQNVNYRNYAEVFKTINKTIQKKNIEKSNLKETTVDESDSKENN
jgi:hypothetical protein